MLRPIKKSKDSQVRADLHHLQLDSNRSELDRCKSSPLYFYNTYIRKEGQPIMSEDEFREYQRVEMEKRHGKRRKPERTSAYLNIIDDGEKLRKEEYPLTPDKAIEPLEISVNSSLQALVDMHVEAKDNIAKKVGIPENRMGESQYIEKIDATN